MTTGEVGTPPAMADVILYCGQITRQGYESLSDLVEVPAHDTCLLVLSTVGGDAHAGYRIARALRHHYSKLRIYVPGYCKSAGTLICMAADELIIDDRGELGPLDVQFQKADELFESTSGLDLSEALNALEGRTGASFKSWLLDLKVQYGLGTKLATALAVQLASDPIRSIYEQIDPLKLGELQRAIRIATEYGERLNAYCKNMKPNALGTLVGAYPAHAFVIDRKEACTLFERVSKPSAQECELRKANATLINNPYDQFARVRRLSSLPISTPTDNANEPISTSAVVPTGEAGTTPSSGQHPTEVC